MTRRWARTSTSRTVESSVPPTGAGRWVRGRWGQGGADAGLGLAAEELLLTEAELGAELFDLLFEEGLALHGAVVHGLPVAGLAPGLELHGEARAHGTGAVGKQGRRAGRGSRRGGQRDPRGLRADRATRRDGHAGRCSPAASADQC